MENQKFGLQMQEMKIKYGGGNTIEVSTYINSLLHFKNVVQEVNKGLSKENKIEVQIKANEKGSFIVDLLIQTYASASLVKQVFSKERLEYVKQVIDTVKEVYKVAKHLKGDKSKILSNDKDSKITIENNNGQIQVFDFRGANLYLNNPLIKESISQEFETLEADKNVTGIEFLNKDNEELLSIAREEFYSLSTSGANQEIHSHEKIINLNAILNISSLDYELKKKWDFYYSGNKISAKIEDLNNLFREKIDNGEKFAKGDSLEVEMEIKQQFDETVNAFINKSYKVIEILSHKERPTQGKLNL